MQPVHGMRFAAVGGCVAAAAALSQCTSSIMHCRWASEEVQRKFLSPAFISGAITAAGAIHSALWCGLSAVVVRCSAAFRHSLGAALPPLSPALILALCRPLAAAAGEMAQLLGELRKIHTTKGERMCSMLVPWPLLMPMAVPCPACWPMGPLFTAVSSCSCPTTDTWTPLMAAADGRPFPSGAGLMIQNPTPGNLLVDDEYTGGGGMRLLFADLGMAKCISQLKSRCAFLAALWLCMVVFPFGRQRN